MNEQQLQEQFMQLLVQEAQQAGAKTEEDVKAYIESLGKEGLQLKYQEFIQQVQLGSIKAALGAKLRYFKYIKGNCPEGQELVYFKKGGRLCKACQGIKASEGAEIEKDPVKKFKKDRKKKYPLIENKKVKYYSDEATRDSIAVNRYNDSNTMDTRPGNIKKGKWVPDRTKAPYNKKK